MARSLALVHHSPDQALITGVSNSSLSVATRRLCGSLSWRLLVDQVAGMDRQRERAFAVAFLLQQHALHVGMLDQRHRLWTTDPSGPAAGPAGVPGIFERIQVAGHAVHDRAHADADARLVHHVEHLGQALVRLAHQIADALAFSPNFRKVLMMPR